MSLAAAVGVATRAKWHKTLEIWVLSMAAYDSLMFMARGRDSRRDSRLPLRIRALISHGAFASLCALQVPDMMDDCHNQQPHGLPGCWPPLTPFYFFFVYFGVLINWIWLGVPVGMILVHVARDLRA